MTEQVKKTHQETVILCYRCLGKGTEDVFCDDPRYEGPWVKPCDVCKGSGRLWMHVKTEYHLFT